jgi:hypothetical protein
MKKERLHGAQESPWRYRRGTFRNIFLILHSKRLEGRLMGLLGYGKDYQPVKRYSLVPRQSRGKFPPQDAPIF